jgi:hypothetical protein
LKRVTNTVEDVYTTVAHGTVTTANNLVNKTAGVIIGAKQTVTNLGNSTQKAISDTRSNLEKGLGDLKLPLLGGLVLAAVIILKK